MTQQLQEDLRVMVRAWKNTRWSAFPKAFHTLRACAHM